MLPLLKAAALLVLILASTIVRATLTDSEFAHVKRVMQEEWNEWKPHCTPPAFPPVVSSLREYEAALQLLEPYTRCLQDGITVKGRRERAQPYINKAFWADMSEAQRKELDAMLEAANQSLAERIAKEVSAQSDRLNESTAELRRRSAAEYESDMRAQQLQDQQDKAAAVSKARSCASKFESVEDTRRDLRRDRAAIEDEDTKLNESHARIAGQVWGNQNEYNVAAGRWNRRAEALNERREAYNRSATRFQDEVDEYKEQCGRLQTSAVREVCSGGDHRKWCEMVLK